jgi:hypothetical protein
MHLYKSCSKARNSRHLCLREADARGLKWQALEFAMALLFDATMCAIDFFVNTDLG